MLLPIDPFYAPFVARSLAILALPLQLRTRWSYSPQPPPDHVTTTTYSMSSVFSTKYNFTSKIKLAFTITPSTHLYIFYLILILYAQQIFINQVCAKGVLSTIVRDMSSSCGDSQHTTSYSCCCTSKSSYFSSVISAVVYDPNEHNFTIEDSNHKVSIELEPQEGRDDIIYRY